MPPDTRGPPLAAFAAISFMALASAFFHESLILIIHIFIFLLWCLQRLLLATSTSGHFVETLFYPNTQQPDSNDPSKRMNVFVYICEPKKKRKKDEHARCNGCIFKNPHVLCADPPA